MQLQSKKKKKISCVIYGEGTEKNKICRKQFVKLLDFSLNDDSQSRRAVEVNSNQIMTQQ